MAAVAPHDGQRSWLVVLALVALWVLVAGGLILGPWSDEPAEVDGWDVARFQEIVDTPGRPYLDHEVEYPPGFLAVLEVGAGPDLVATSDRIALLALLADLAVGAVLLVGWGRRAASAWLVLGLPLVLSTYQRLDVLSVLLAVAALALVRRHRPAWAATALASAVLVKTWPVVVLGAFLRPARRAALAGTVALVAVAGVMWVSWGGLGAPAQVFGFRGATGWHVESTPGLVAGLWSGARAEVESGSYRLGQASIAVRSGLTLLSLVGYALVWSRALRERDGERGDPEVDRADALALTASVALLLVTAPLFSPQYMLWLLAWAAMAWALGDRLVAVLVGVATVATSLVLVAFGPDGVDTRLPEAALLARNGVLVAVVVVAIARLGAPVAHAPEPDQDDPCGRSVTAPG